MASVAIERDYYVDVVSLGIVAILTFLSLKSSINARLEAGVNHVYQDEDGVATKESEAASSGTVSRSFINVGAAIGLSTVLFDARYTLSSSPWKTPELVDWPWIGIWILISVQAITITGEPKVLQRYNHGINIAISTTVIVASTIYKGSPLRDRGYELPWSQLIAALMILLTFLSLPRRPTVFFQGHQIDQEHGASLFARFSFSWGPFHRSGRDVPEKIGLQDLPAVAHSLRVRTLKERFRVMAGKTSLWRQLARTFLARLIHQWLLVLIKALSEFGSRFALYQLLKCLENYSASDGETWMWTIGLGLGLLAETIVSGWLSWVTQMKLEMPVIALLNGLVFEKMTKRQVLYETASSEKQTKEGKKTDQPSGPSLADMISNDSSTVSQACGHSHHFPMAAFKLLLDVTYLARLIGIKSILVGGTSSFILIPLSTRLSKRHRTLQAELSKTHDALSNFISEALQGLRQIRLSSTERVWEGRILDWRARELDQIWRAGATLALMTLVANLGPILLASVALSVCSFETGHLSPSVAFASLSLFGNLHEVIRDLPLMATNMHKSWVSCQRIQQYLEEPEQNPSYIPSDRICLEEATLAWPRGSSSLLSSTTFELRDVNLSFPKGKLSIITGKTGSGKGLLVASILEEAKLVSGRLEKPAPTASVKKGIISHEVSAGMTALVSQPPWIENCTVRDNILFGYPFDEARYQKVLYACALDQDLKVLSEGDLTKAGVNGGMLSGGQKWRVALARALYSPAEILILEDVLSAVDAPVARWICDNALTGELAEGRTRLLVTHHPELCIDAASYLVVLQDGTASGSSKSEARVISMKTTSDKEMMKPIAEAPGDSEEKSKAQMPAKQGPKQAASRNNWQIFSAYLWASGGVRVCIWGVLVALGYQISSASHSWWLARWTAHQHTGKDMMLYNIGVYLALSIGNGIALAIQSLVVNGIGLRASKSLFQRMVHSVLAAPLGWIDSTPLGRVLQSLGGDMYLIDHRSAPEMNSLLGNVVHLILIVLTSFISAPYTVFSSIALLVLYLRVASQYFILSRGLKRLIPVSHRPILEHANSTAAGLATIRAFGRSQFYVERMYDLIDVGTKVGWHLALGMRWMNVRLGFLGAMFVASTAAALVFNKVDAATAGFTITLALQLKTALAGTLNKVSVLNMGSNAIERVLNLAAIPTETTEGEDPPESWPANGAVQVHDLTVRYDPALPPALKAISFSLKPRQRLGIVGRTGAGKSSLASAFLRFIDLAEGKILIDGLDISTIKLARLRSAVAIIPQDPFLFSGTLRSNLDLHGDRADAELRFVLRRVHLLSDEDGEFGDLDMVIHPGGVNFSHGQRQLVCLARAMLARCRILILDEATSAMDSATDAAIQQVIRDEFSDATILVVAHKLLTVADFDSILVLSNGEVVEFGSPAELMAGERVFWDMVRQSGDGERIRLVIGS